MEATKSYSEAARPETLHLLLPKYSHFVFICFFISSVSSSVSFFFRARKSWLFIAIPMTPKKFYCHNPLTQVFNTSVSVKVPWALGTAICIVIFITGNALLALKKNQQQQLQTIQTSETLAHVEREILVFFVGERGEWAKMEMYFNVALNDINQDHNLSYWY